MRRSLHLPAGLFLAAIIVAGGWFLLPRNKRVIVQGRAELSETASQAAPAGTALKPESRDPREPGLRHISTLQLAGSYAQAADFAVASSLDYRRDFTIAAYHEWGRNQPEQAIASAIRIEDAFTRDFALHSVLSGWARSDPEGMAEAALGFPEGVEKTAALTKALRSWMHKDPELAGDWIMAHEAAIPVADEFFRKDRR